MGDTGVLLTRARKGAEGRSILWRASIVLMLAWFAFVLRAAYLLAKGGAAELAGRVAARTWPGQLESLRFVAALAAVIVVPVLVARVARPALAVPTLAIIGGIVTLGLAVGAEAIIDLSLLLWLGLACHELGRLALAALRLPPGDRLDAFVLHAGLGTGLLSLGGLALGTAGLLNLPVLVAALTALLFSAEWRWLQAIAPARRRRRRRLRFRLPVGPTLGWFEVALLATTTFFLLVGYTMGLAPEVMSDAVRQHLAVAREYAGGGRLGGIPHLGLSYSPLGGEILFTAGMILHGQILAKLIHTGVGLLAVVAVGAIGRRAGGRAAGFVAAATFASLPVVVWEAGTGYIDLFVALYAALVALCLLRWQKEGGHRWPLLLGAFLGFGFAAKLTFGFVIAAAGLAVVIIGRRGASPRARVHAALAVGIGGTLTGGPWLARTVAVAGQIHIPGLALFLDAIGRGAGERPASLSNLTEFGIGRTPDAALRLPWEITVLSGQFGENAHGFVGFTLLLLLPTLLLLRPRRATIALGALVLVPFLLWFATAQYIRYLLPTLAILAALLGAGFARLRGATARHASPRRFLFEAGLLGALALAIVPYLTTIFAYPGALPVRLVLGRERPGEYLERTLGGYEALQLLDRAVPAGTRVAAMGQDQHLYSQAVLYTPFNGAPELLYARSVPELFGRLNRLGITHLLIDRKGIPAVWNGAIVLQPEFLRRYAELVRASGTTFIYQLREDGAAVATPLAGRELLENSGFESGQGAPALWNRYGEPIHDTGGTRAHRGRGAVRATTEDGFHQAASVRPGKTYVLTFFARSDQPGAAVRLQINWVDADGKMLNPAFQVAPVGTDWAEQTMWATAPAGAAFGYVYVATHADAPCWFDDFSLREAP